MLQLFPLQKVREIFFSAFCRAKRARIFFLRLFAVQKGQEIFFPAFCRAKRARNFFLWLFAVQKGQEIFSPAFCRANGHETDCGAAAALHDDGYKLRNRFPQRNWACANQDISDVPVIDKTKEMKNVLFSGMKVAEVADLAHNIGGLFNSISAKFDDEYLLNVMADLDGLSKRISVVLNHSQIVTSLEKLDLHRDRCVSAILNLRRAYAKLSDDNIQSHWMSLKPVLEEYLSSISSGNYQSKTALVKSMLDKFSQPDMAVHVEALPGLELALKKLHEAQDAFVDMRLEYQKLALDGHPESATELKGQIVALLNGKLLLHLTDMSRVKPEIYGDFTTLVMNLVESSNGKVRRRRGKKETSSDIPAKE